MKRFEDILTRTLEFALALALLGIVSIVVVQVFLSAAFNASITGANEMITKLFVYTTAIGAAVAVGKGEHITITVAVHASPQSFQRWMEKAALVAVGIFNAVLLAYSFRWIGTTGHFLMPTTQLPRIVAQLSIPLGCGLALLYCVLRLTSSTADAGEKEETGGAHGP